MALYSLSANNKIECPICRADITVPAGGADEFPTNRYIVEALERNRFDNDVNRVIEGDAGRINENNDAIGDILRDIIIHRFSAETDIDAGIRGGTSEARNNRSTVDSQSRRDNASHGTRIGNLVNTEELRFTGFLNYIRHKFVSCKQTCKSACPVVCGIFLFLVHLFSLGLGIYIIVDLAT